MQASVGDRLIIGGHRVGPTARHGEVLEVRGDEGGPPYLVRWDETDHPTLFFPGSDCTVQHTAAANGEAS